MLLGRLETAKYRVVFVSGSGCKFNVPTIPIGINLLLGNALANVPTIQIGMNLLLGWFLLVGETASTDEELAVLLRERTLQYDDSIFAVENEIIAQVSLEYIIVSIFYVLHGQAVWRILTIKRCLEVWYILFGPYPPAEYLQLHHLWPRRNALWRDTTWTGTRTGTSARVGRIV